LIRVCSFIGLSFPRSNRMELCPCCCDNLRPKPCASRAASALGQPPAELQLPPTRRSRNSHDLRRLGRLRRDPASCEGGGCGSVNRDVVVGSDLACPDISFELHNRSPSRSALLYVTAQSRWQNLSSVLKIFLDRSADILGGLDCILPPACAES
jgi:hypothetical protein